MSLFTNIISPFFSNTQDAVMSLVLSLLATTIVTVLLVVVIRRRRGQREVERDNRNSVNLN